MEIRSSNDINIYGMKSEGNKPVLIVNDSQDIGLFGYGGNASALPGQALFILQDSSNVRLVNLVEAPRAGKGDPDSMFGVGVNPGKWHMVDFRNGKSVKTKPFHRPVLYLYNDKIVHDDIDRDL